MCATVKTPKKSRWDRLDPEKRARLFRLAGEEFSTQGFAQSSLNRIISGAGMSKSSFYHFFENKADLFRATIEDAFASTMHRLDDFSHETLDAESFWPTLRAMAESSAEMASQSPEIMAVGRMFYSSLDTPDERELVSGFIDIFTNWLDDMIGRGQELGLVREDLPRQLLIDLWVGLSMTLDRWVVDNWETLSQEDKANLGGHSFDLVRRMLDRQSPVEG